MHIDQIIQSRRSVYPTQMSGEKIPNQFIERMLANAIWAPTHHLSQPWQFVVYEGDAKNKLLDYMAFLYSTHTPEERFSSAKYEKFEKRKQQVSHIIAINMRRHERDGLPEGEEIAAVAMAVQNMWLTLADHPGYGGYWSSGNLVYLRELADYMHLNDHERCLGLFYLGCVAEDASLPERQRNKLSEHLRWEK